MTGIHTLLATGATLLATLLACAAEVPVTFTLVDSERTGTVSYSKGDTSQQTIHHSGTLDAELSFDPSTNRVTAIRFTGANISESPTAFKNTVNVYIPGVGTKKVIFEKSSSALRMRLDTLGAAHPVASDGRILEPERLRSYPIAGILTAKITLDGRTQTQQINVANNPPDRIDPATGADLTLSVVETARHQTTSDYRVTFLSEIDESRSQSLPDNNGTLTSSIAGFSRAEATFTAPNAFGQWLSQNGYSPGDATSTNPSGIPLEMLFAFDLPAQHAGKLPWSFQLESNQLVLALQLPSNGPRRALQIQTCSNLHADAWVPLPDTAFLDGDGQQLHPGTQLENGQVRIQVPDTHSYFYRLSTTND
ncbi:hypothetical protein [Pelagicoccus sp. SDUM812005]|uniref:hypothetical protein n=1 Tax=Pelagicoccus sp. SDUM812005 TaxID=3041257 RepID=UPI00280E0A78|nr:hypothetical protein [Pelagicoccus sp. SDUM812005]MDQ8179926.1 hypothetical protein [Pelagicoccus sp. SDUM812005]